MSRGLIKFFAGGILLIWTLIMLLAGFVVGGLAEGLSLASGMLGHPETVETVSWLVSFAGDAGQFILGLIWLAGTGIVLLIAAGLMRTLPPPDQSFAYGNGVVIPPPLPNRSPPPLS